MPAPQVSVLIPVRDAAATLETCLRSLARQTLTAWECVVVDDGSADASLELVRRAARAEPRIRVLCQSRRGLVAALQRGLAACSAPLVARMDADDIMHHRRLELQARALAEQPAWSAVGCHVRLFPRDGLRGGMRRYERWLNGITSPVDVRRDAFVECPIAHPTLLARTAVLRGLGYRATEGPEDYDLVLRMLGTGHTLGMVPRRLLCWRDSPKRLSRTSPRYATQAFTACKAEHLAAGLLAQSPHYVLWGYGATGRALASALALHDKHPSAIVEMHPGRIGNRIRGAPVIRPNELADRPRLPLVASVAGPSPRDQIRSALAELGYRETRDFVVAA